MTSRVCGFSCFFFLLLSTVSLSHWSPTLSLSAFPASTHSPALPLAAPAVAPRGLPTRSFLPPHPPPPSHWPPPPPINAFKPPLRPFRRPLAALPSLSALFTNPRSVPSLPASLYWSLRKVGVAGGSEVIKGGPFARSASARRAGGGGGGGGGGDPQRSGGSAGPTGGPGFCPPSGGGPPSGGVLPVPRYRPDSGPAPW